MTKFVDLNFHKLQEKDFCTFDQPSWELLPHRKEIESYIKRKDPKIVQTIEEQGRDLFWAHIPKGNLWRVRELTETKGVLYNVSKTALNGFVVTVKPQLTQRTISGGIKVDAQCFPVAKCSSSTFEKIPSVGSFYSYKKDTIQTYAEENMDYPPFIFLGSHKKWKGATQEEFRQADDDAFANEFHSDEFGESWPEKGDGLFRAALKLKSLTRAEEKELERLYGLYKRDADADSRKTAYAEPFLDLVLLAFRRKNRHPFSTLEDLRKYR